MGRVYKILAVIIITAVESVYSQNELTADKIYEKVDNSVVVILAYDKEGTIYQGSGVVIDKKGLIVTNYHVCKDANRIEIKHYGKEFKNVDIFLSDERKDILVLKISDNPLNPIELGNSNDLKPGQRVYAVGSPEGYENSISEGIISGFRTDENNLKLIQMTTPITDGSSGGAILDSKGELIGLSVSGQHEGNLYFAIPVNDVCTLLGINSGTPITETDDPGKNDPSKYYEIGKLANDKENYTDAEIYLSKYLEKFSSDANAYFSRGYARFKLKEYKNAINDFTKVLDKNGNKESYFYRGNCYYNLKDYENAFNDYTKAIEQEPDNANMYYNRGYASFRLKNYEEALGDWKKAIELNPDYQSELSVKMKIALEQIEGN